MLTSLLKNVENERLRTAYILLRGKFARLVDVLEKYTGEKQGYQGVEAVDRHKVSFSLCFFDRIMVVAEFSAVIEEKRQMMLGRIVFSQNGNPCRTYYFDEFDNIYDAFGHEFQEGKLFDVKLASHMLNEVYHKLIDDGVAFESIKLWS